ncbi:MAG: hypothetical protein ACKOW9_02830 [Candidatus Paceibacterota bacterium]
MSFFLVLFLTSVTGMVALIGRKVYTLRNTDVHVPMDFDFSIDVPDFEEVGQHILKKSKRYSYILLVITIRAYVLGTHATKKQIQKVTQIIKKRLHKRHARPIQTPTENKFLKRVTEYKHRIRKIKEQIKTEEGLN